MPNADNTANLFSDVVQGLTPDELLAQAARAAKLMLPGLEARVVQLSKEQEELQAQLVKVRYLAGFASSVGPERPSALRRSTAGLRAQADEKNAARDVDVMLLAIPEPMTVKELRDSIKQQFDRLWAESTLYSHLGKGKTEGRYVNDNNRWALSEQGRKDVL